jgi:hypothetical protein
MPSALSSFRNLPRLYRILSLGFMLSAEAGALSSGSAPQHMTPFHLYGWALAVAGLVLIVYWLIRRKPKSADDLERERRAWLDQVGRITDGTVIDVQEIPGKDKSATVLIYHYDVAGVSYECSQDVTYLRPMINLHSCRLGLPTSVRYDPQNPGNSLVVSERWMGLRQ